MCPTALPTLLALQSPDDLTSTLTNIVETNNRLQQAEARGAATHQVEDLLMAMSNLIWGYMNNASPSIATVKNRSDNPIKSISERLKGKHGRVRGNLMGKRVDFSARSVITGDANIGIDELGVPYSIARNLTFPERVTPLNQHILQAMVAAGPDPPPGVTGAKVTVRMVLASRGVAGLGWYWAVVAETGGL